MADLNLKQEDTSPGFLVTLKDSDGNPVNLTNASVRFLMRRKDGTGVKVDETATITDESGGKVVYKWKVGDTDEVGTFDAEWEVTYADGTIETFPNNEYLSVKILDDIA